MIPATQDHYVLSLKNMTQEQFVQEYLTAKEEQWSALVIPMLEAIDQEVRRRGLRQNLSDQVGELVLPHERWMIQRMSETAEKFSASEKSNTPLPGPSSKAPMGFGDTSTASGFVRAAARASQIAPPSSEERVGAQIGAAGTFGIEAYLRLPLMAKRDAFVTDGMLFVRRSVFREWVEHFVAGRCCEPSKRGEGAHASDCWIHRDAVR
jgi:hypothetical protein